MDTLLIQEKQNSRESKSKSAAIVKKTKSFWASSRGRIFLVWSLTLTIIIAMDVMIPYENDRALEASFLVTTLLSKYQRLVINL